MTAADERRDAAARWNVAGWRTERDAFDAIRRRLGLPVPADPGWTVCSAPSNQLVIARDGSMRGCDQGACGVASAPFEAGLLDAWRGDAGVQVLRQQLAAGKVPASHCGGCATWLALDLVEQAPPLRDHGATPAEPGQPAPRELILRLPGAGHAWPPELAAQIAETLPGVPHVVFDAVDLDDPTALSLLRALRRLDRRPTIALRVRDARLPPGLRQALDGLVVTQLELAATSVGTDLAAGKALAAALGARFLVRFVFTPDSWFHFEDVARAAAALAVPLDLRVLDRDGAVPLLALSIDDLRLVKDVIISMWPRWGGPDAPASLAERRFDELCRELRALLQRRAEQELARGAADAPAAAALALPLLDHPWCDDPARQPWWFAHLIGKADLAVVQRWLHDVAADPAAARQRTWLRVLCHRVAAERRSQPLLDLLRTLYEDDKARARLAAADAAFAAEFDLRPHGGPWAERLGLARERARKRPFTIGKARAPQPGATPDLTVLIPSYRHGLYIEETIRSVLAQRYTDFELLIVDDCSPDDTVARARSFDDPRITVRVNESNLGLGNSVLKALATIRTPYVALLNSDDVFHPDRLQACRDVLEERAGVQLVTTGLSLIDHRGGELTPANASLVLDGLPVFDWVNWYARAMPAADLPNDELFAALLERNFLATSSNLVARTDWLRAQADSLQSLKYCLDWQLFLEAAVEKALFHLHEPLVAYRLHATNTVWFSEGRRWSYYLEVNRVAASALRRFANQDERRDEGDIARVLDAMARHLAVNRETDGFALFLNSAFDALRLEHVADTSPRVQRLVEHLNTIAEEVRRARDAAVARHDEGDGTRTAHRLLLGELAAEQVEVERDNRRWLQGYAQTLEARLDAARTAQEQLQQRTRELQQDLAGVRGDLTTVRSALESARGAAAAVNDLREVVLKELAAAREELDAMIRGNREMSVTLAEERAEASKLRERRDRLQADLATAYAKSVELEQRQRELAATVEHQAAEVRALGLAKAELTQELAKERTERERLARSRELRIGNFLWNKTPLGYVSRRGKKWYRRLLDAKARALMSFRRRRADGVAIVTACWQWPIYSHTFVYQEMLGLTHMGLDVRLFHWDLGDASQMHKAFAYLADNRVQLQPLWENHLRDKEHFDKTKPGRLRAFLERVAQATGRSADELAKEPLVLQGCTFARMAELAGARYLHSYFFYDQSFMAMQAAWLLDLPRGVSCYADHMLDDYPFKLVNLHVELAGVVVATSARIKRELSQKSGGKHDDKIIVKPNGVDGARFPAIERSARARGETFEVVSISRIEPKKGLIHLVEAVAELRRRGIAIVAHVIGSKDPHSKGSLEYAAEFERRIDELDVAGQIVLHGVVKQEDLPPILRRCRAFVAPYVEIQNGDKDGIPTAMLEGLASCMPVVTTDSGSILEVITNEVEGLVVPQRDSAAFANAIARLIHDPALEQRMGKAGRARFERDFDIRVTEQRLHEHVAALLAAKKRAR